MESNVKDASIQTVVDEQKTTINVVATIIKFLSLIPMVTFSSLCIIGIVVSTLNVKLPEKALWLPIVMNILFGLNFALRYRYDNESIDFKNRTFAWSFFFEAIWFISLISCL